MTDSRIHPTAIVEDGAVLGSETVIGPFCVVGKDHDYHACIAGRISAPSLSATTRKVCSLPIADPPA